MRGDARAAPPWERSPRVPVLILYEFCSNCRHFFQYGACNCVRLSYPIDLPQVTQFLVRMLHLSNTIILAPSTFTYSVSCVSLFSSTFINVRTMIGCVSLQYDEQAPSWKLRIHRVAHPIASDRLGERSSGQYGGSCYRIHTKLIREPEVNVLRVK